MKSHPPQRKDDNVLIHVMKIVAHPEEIETDALTEETVKSEEKLKNRFCLPCGQRSLINVMSIQ
jgi:hypothetical protein